MWIKICGIRDVETALAVAQSRPNAIGLNFYYKSPRAVGFETALEIVSRLPSEVEPVGVFVNEPAETIRGLCRRCGITTVQLHGVEPPERIAELDEFRVIRAFRVNAQDGLGPIESYLADCRRFDALPWACLIDAQVAGAYGGTGQSAPWEVVRRYPTAEWPPLILAGGLSPDNVAQAVREVAPWGVDVASGVESSIAFKDPELVRQFVASASASR